MTNRKTGIYIAAYIAASIATGCIGNDAASRPEDAGTTANVGGSSTGHSGITGGAKSSAANTITGGQSAASGSNGIGGASGGGSTGNTGGTAGTATWGGSGAIGGNAPLGGTSNPGGSQTEPQTSADSRAPAERRQLKVRRQRAGR